MQDSGLFPKHLIFYLVYESLNRFLDLNHLIITGPIMRGIIASIHFGRGFGHVSLVRYCARA